MTEDKIRIHRGALKPQEASLIAIREGGILVRVYVAEESEGKLVKQYIPNHHFDYIEWVA